MNQTLAAIRFNINVSSKLEPFFLLYKRDVVLLIDNLLKLRRKYQGEELHPIALQEQHKSFTLVRRFLKQTKKRQTKYADKGTRNFRYNEPVYYKDNQMKGKLECKWRPFYRIIGRKGPATYVIKNQLNAKSC